MYQIVVRHERSNPISTGYFYASERNTFRVTKLKATNYRLPFFGKLEDGKSNDLGQKQRLVVLQFARTAKQQNWKQR